MPGSAREWASTAILYFSTAFLWWALVWNLGFGRWPWQKDGPWVVGFSKMFVVLFFAVITFAVMFHPHICVLFPEAQKMVGAQARWEVWAEVPSGGWALVLCTLFWVVFCDLFWEGQPFRLMDQDAFFDSYEFSYALTLAEEELVLDSARQAGIKTEGRDKNEIAKELFSKQGRSLSLGNIFTRTYGRPSGGSFLGGAVARGLVAFGGGGL